MAVWRPQLYRRKAKAAGIPGKVVASAVAAAGIVTGINPSLPPVFTLGHLAHLAGVDYNFLRNVISREVSPYRTFRIRKRPSRLGEKRFRVIAIPDPRLLRVQTWISRFILAETKPHDASVAYSRGDTLLNAVAVHCGCEWLIKMDVQNFFESITEIAAYRVFRSMGYQSLISFEMARICTRVREGTILRSRDRWRSNGWSRPAIKDYSRSWMGHLPQGAPTSPMLANLAVRAFDGEVTGIAEAAGLTYTRYADDLAISNLDKEFSRKEAGELIGAVYSAMGRAGLSPNVTKTQVIPPGARKLLLGLLIDGPEPRLTRDFKAKMRQHVYYLTNEDFGPNRHATARGFTSLLGLRHHIEGLLSYAHQIEPKYAAICKASIANVDWPI